MSWLGFCIHITHDEGGRRHCRPCQVQVPGTFTTLNQTKQNYGEIYDERDKENKHVMAMTMQ